MSARIEFAAVLRSRMDGRTQGELAADLGIDQASVSRYLRGTHKPSPATARRMVERCPELVDVLQGLLLWDVIGPRRAGEEVA